MYVIIDNNVIRSSDGKIVAPCQSTDDPDYQMYIAWVAAGNNPPVVNTVANTLPAAPKIKVGAFRERLGNTVKVKIEMASLDNPAAPLEQRMLAAKLRVMKEDTANSSHIDLGRTDLKAGLLELKAVGIMTDADIDRVYAPPFRDDELWHG